MKNLKTNWLFKHTLTVFSCVLIVVLGIAFLSHADPVTTTIGENISTNSLTATGLTVNGATSMTADLTIQEAGDAKITVYSNTDSPTADSKLLVVQKGATPSELFSVDEDGDVVVANDLSVTGNVTSGTWQGTAVETQYGGTGQDWSAVAQGNLPYFSAEGALSNLAPGTAGQFLKSQGAGADPEWAGVTRSATFVVAANDSATLSKQQADYVCDGTDDQVEIQAAIDALPSGGGKVVLMEGEYNVTGSGTTIDVLTITMSNVTLEGQGKTTHIKVVSDESRYVVHFNNVSNCIIRDIWVDGNDLGGYAIRFTESTECKILDCIAGNTWADGIVGHDLSYSLIKGNIVYDCESDGHGDCSSGIEIEDGCDHLNIEANILYDCKSGIWIKRHVGEPKTHDILVAGNILHNSPIVATTEDAELNENINIIGNMLDGTTTGCPIRFLNVVNSVIKNNVLYNPVYSPGAIYTNANCDAVHIINNRVFGASENGICSLGENSIIANNHISDSSLRGIYVAGAMSIVKNNQIRNSGAGAATTYSGIFVRNSEKIDIHGNICFDDQDIKTQKYGIEILEWLGDSNDISIMHNTVRDNAIAGIYVIAGAEDIIVCNNIGYTTENSGTATLASGTTSIVVTHGLAVTPSAGDITVTPIEAWGAMTEFYIDTYTSTQFTIHADQNPTQDVDFAWKAIVL